MRSQLDLNVRNKQSHIWAGRWNPACVDTPISVGAQCEAAFNTNLIVSALSKQRQHTRLEPHGAECVQSTDHDTQDGRRGGWGRGGRGEEGRKEWMTNKTELKSKREDRRVKRKGFQWKSRFERRREDESKIQRTAGRKEWGNKGCTEWRQKDRWTGQVSVHCLDADTLWQLCFVRLISCSLGLLGSHRVVFRCHWRRDVAIIGVSPSTVCGDETLMPRPLC